MRLPRITEPITDRAIMWLAIAAATVSLAAGTIATVAIIRVGNQAESAEQTAAINCWRSKTLARYGIDDFIDRGVYPPEIWIYARTSVPKTCPPIAPNLMPPSVPEQAAPRTP